MASNDQQDKNAVFDRRNSSASVNVNFQTSGPCTNSAMMKNTVPTNKTSSLQNVKSPVPNASYFSSWETSSSMPLNSNTLVGSSSIPSNAIDNGGSMASDGVVIGRSSGSSSALAFRSSGGWNASGILMQSGGTSTPGMIQLACDNGFAERAARFSCFGGAGGSGAAFNLSEAVFTRSGVDNSVIPKIPRPTNMAELIKAAASPSKEEVCTPRKAGRLSRSSTPGGNDSDDAEASTAREDSSSSEQITGEAAGRKRKQMQQLPKDKAKELSPSEAGMDRKSIEPQYIAPEGLLEKDDIKSKAEQSSSVNAKALDAPKEDYIHVRARRGQATNSHSLAERVRREKISERMKFLQDLVPGCSKVTGKAVMLDEIINYVQSLQRQVEFLSMKLAAVNPRLDFNIEALLAKDLRGSLPTMLCAPEANTSYPQLHQSQQGLLQVATEGHGVLNQAEAIRRTMNAQLACVDGYGDALAQLSNVWDDELQSIVQMGFAQNIQTPFKSQGNSGSMPTSNMKAEH
ncbi:hypothetical protein SUGI_0238500 [Cryptomeria japonica]|uniref:transcription factor bHLH49 n=1 Tax=Cryptomeria japonica TaxID=3369 RepID=UPI002408E9E4|nr:transcription factor bHLH49 [Cryptomeria japonica]GLJ14713.1 hypothetical protein SUGI_0238500 [Cryptomeria japonica]